MATQRVTLAKVGGMAGQAIAAMFQRWSAVDSVQPELDRFAQALRSHGWRPPTLYFCEWADCWSMGDVVLALGDERAVVVRGDKFEASCFRLPATLRAPTLGNEPTQETKWLAARLREMEDAWVPLCTQFVLIVLREAIGPAMTDDEVRQSLDELPSWLCTLKE